MTAAQGDVHGLRAVDDWHAAAWMQTFTGRAFRPFHADVEDIDEQDIARSLSMTCRYNGHVERFYSVAEHCVLMAQHFMESTEAYGTGPLTAAEKNADRELALWALLHDAAEAYIGDMVRPLKVTDEMEAYRVLDDRLTGVIASKYGLAGTIPAAIKEADNRILLDERAELLGNPAEPWHQDTNGTQPLGVRIWGWSPKYAEQMYLATLDELTGGTK